MSEEVVHSYPAIKRYARFNEQGQILSILTMPEHMDHPFDDLLEIDDSVGTLSHYVDVAAQEVRMFTPDEQARYLNRPVYLAQWNGAVKAWEDLRSLDEMRAAKWSEIKAAREAAEFSSFTCLGYEFDCDRESVTRLMGAIQLAQMALSLGESFAIDWTLADNTVVSLSALDLIQAGQALGVHVNTAHAKARILREQIDVAPDAAAVRAISW